MPKWKAVLSRDYAAINVGRKIFLDIDFNRIQSSINRS
jgi:hypothetical protein